MNNPAPEASVMQSADLDLICECDDDGSFALVWRNGWAITASPTGRVIVTKSPRERDIPPFGCDVSELRPNPPTEPPPTPDYAAPSEQKP